MRIELREAKILPNNKDCLQNMFLIIIIKIIIIVVIIKKKIEDWFSGPGLQPYLLRLSGTLRVVSAPPATLFWLFSDSSCCSPSNDLTLEREEFRDAKRPLDFFVNFNSFLATYWQSRKMIVAHIKVKFTKNGTVQFPHQANGNKPWLNFKKVTF